jgi:hypothetical protein
MKTQVIKYNSAYKNERKKELKLQCSQNKGIVKLRWIFKQKLNAQQ